MTISWEHMPEWDAEIRARAAAQQQWTSGGGLYGGYWASDSSAFGGTASQSHLGTFAQQALAAQAAAIAQLNSQQIAFPAFNTFGPAREPDPPIEDAGISAGEIIGHRAWRCYSGLLQSMAVDRIWSPNEPMEGEPNRDRDGVHAFKSRSEALSTYGGRSYGTVAVGTVLLWGKVIEHEKGYRAQFGKVNSIDLICNVGWWHEMRTLRRLRARYGV